MAVELIRRASLGRPRSFAEDDGNLDAIEGAVNIAPQYIWQSYIPVTRLSDNTADDQTYMVLASVSTGIIMGANSKISIVAEWGLMTTGTKTVSITFGGSEISGIPLTTTIENKFLIEIQNLGSLGLQGIFNGSSYAASTNARVSTTIDTSYSQTIEFRVKWGSPALSQTITLRGYSIIHYPGIA
jgi:hypothetical protein